MAGGHLAWRHGEDDAIGVGQFDAAAHLHKGDWGAFGNGDAQLIGQEAHDRGLPDPGDLLEGDAALRQGHEKQIASDVRSEDGEEIGAAQLAVAEGLDGSGGIDAEARIVIEEAAGGEEESGDEAERGEESSGEGQPSQGGASPGGEEAATDGNTAAGAEKGLFRVVVGVGGGTRRAR